MISFLKVYNVDNRINNIVKGYKSSSNNRNNSICNVDILGNRKIINREPGFNEISNNYPYSKEWKCLYKCQNESDNIYCSINLKPTYPRNVNDDNNIIGQHSRTNTDPITDPSRTE
ncbi:hypothetical protein BCR32DRAFT_275333 [Anaeromyces robustus]|uniref:Uncharacterized protein n=1 Tax=Anaeromyces robustus TaxID=1754192 RepID=A0A1Y1XLB5_9FUNG|nr:hypothetical protein BCR32DRAFT_275333 [Anaeromyces robustus]|eukprot:ORX86549.1 hypothetical protein BCR32DRAFT_275333 [Anaeromyces robustus]